MVPKWFCNGFLNHRVRGVPSGSEITPYKGVFRNQNHQVFCTTLF